MIVSEKRGISGCFRINDNQNGCFNNNNNNNEYGCFGINQK